MINNIAWNEEAERAALRQRFGVELDPILWPAKRQQLLDEDADCERRNAQLAEVTTRIHDGAMRMGDRLAPLESEVATKRAAWLQACARLEAECIVAEGEMSALRASELAIQRGYSPVLERRDAERSIRRLAATQANGSSLISALSKQTPPSPVAKLTGVALLNATVGLGSHRS